MVSLRCHQVVPLSDRLAFVCGAFAGPTRRRDVTSPCSPLEGDILPIVFTLAVAAEPTKRSAVLVDPIGPVVATTLFVAQIPTVDANLRVHHMVRPHLGATVRWDLATTKVAFTRASYTGVRFGGRYAVRERGLDDWALTPFGLLGVGWNGVRGSGVLASYGVAGLGLEVGRVWTFGGLAFELGIGAVVQRGFAYRGHVEAFADGTAPGWGVRPTFTVGFGHAR